MGLDVRMVIVDDISAVDRLFQGLFDEGGGGIKPHISKKYPTTQFRYKDGLFFSLSIYGRRFEGRFRPHLFFKK